MARDSEQIVADAREVAQILRAQGARFDVDYVERMLSELVESAEDWFTWLSEGDAMIRCGRKADWLRGRFEGWRRDGHARLVGRSRQYRACIVPRRANVMAAAERGREAARKAS